MLNQFEPDWSKTWTVAQAELELTKFKFKGPGWYASDTDSMLVIPIDRSNWDPGQPKEGEMFRFCIWNTPNVQELYRNIAYAPSYGSPK